MFPDVWTVVLAAGSGRRLAHLTGGIPKQFWRPSGAPASLVEQTVARLTPLAAPVRTVTVVHRSHRPFVNALDTAAALGTIVPQPEDRGTTAGVLLPLLRVLACSPDPIVVVAPSDHAFADRPAMLRGLRLAVERIRAGKTDIVLFGVEPTHVARDLGWVSPSAECRRRRERFSRVSSFVEKPDEIAAQDLFERGAVWNTMIVAARGRALLDRFQQSLPLLTDVLLTASAMSASDRDLFLDDWYPELPHADFSRDLLSSSRPLCLFTWPAAIGWSDLGTPERLAAWMAGRELTGAPLARRTA